MEHPLALDVVVQPAPQARPGPGECLVGELQDPVVAGDEPRCDQLLDEVVAVGVGGHHPAGDPAAHRFALGAGCHEPQDQVAQGVPLVDRDPGVQRLRRLGDGPVDAARGAVAGDRQRVALAATPRLVEHVRQQGQCARVVLHLAHEEVDEPGLDHQPGLAGRRLDRLGQPVLAEAADDVEPALDEPGEVGMRREVGEMVGTQREHDRAHLASAHQRAQELLPLPRVVAQREELLELVDQQGGTAATPARSVRPPRAGRQG